MLVEMGGEILILRISRGELKNIGVLNMLPREEFFKETQLLKFSLFI